MKVTTAKFTVKLSTETLVYRGAAKVRCEKGHSGNTTYVNHSRGYWECQGCGDLVSANLLAQRQQSDAD